jgi:hypothetical protein
LGWFLHDGDVSYGRLAKIPEITVQWFHVVPPIALLVLTRYGVPVSTTFLILTVFAPGNLGKMLTKSLLGYLVAFVVAIVVYRAVMFVFERRFLTTVNQPAASYWVVIQWLSTAFLWSQWLIQDLANIYVFLPRGIGALTLALSVLAMIGMQGIIFYTHGGEIQHIVTSKTNTQDIRSASIIDFIYGLILFFFKEMSHVPMSTTWVFLGLLAGREFALSLGLGTRTPKETWFVVGKDGLKALFGLLVSILLAFGLPKLDALF